MSDTFFAGLQGGFDTLLEEAKSGFSVPVDIFANAPAGTYAVRFTIRGGSLTITTDGSTPSAAANGCDYAPGTYEEPGKQGAFKRWKAIQSGGTATAWVQYLGANR